MRINKFMLAMTLLIGGVILYSYILSGSEIGTSLIGSIIPTLFLGCSMSISLHEKPRQQMLMKVVSALSFVLLLFLNIVLNIFATSTGALIITNAIVVIISMIIIYLLIKSDI